MGITSDTDRASSQIGLGGLISLLRPHSRPATRPPDGRPLKPFLRAGRPARSAKQSLFFGTYFPFVATYQFTDTHA
jgi:hypothetical protein